MGEFIPFFEFFPELALKETTIFSADVTGKNNHRILGNFWLVDSYCSDLSCDCQKVMLNVIPTEPPKDILATIGYGWGSDEYYTNWAGGNADLAKQIRGIYLEKLCIQSEYSQSFLQAIEKNVMSDEYIAKMKRHYQQFKDYIQATNNLVKKK